MFRRAAASVIIAGALVLGTSACNFFAPQRTLDIYNPGDGVSATVGDVRVINAMAIASEDGEALSLVFTISNNGTRGVSVSFQYEAGGDKRTETRFVNAGASESVGYEGAEGDQIIITGSEAELGGSLPVFVQHGTETGSTLLVPVLTPDTVPGYELIAPETGA